MTGELARRPKRGLGSGWRARLSLLFVAAALALLLLPAPALAQSAAVNAASIVEQGTRGNAYVSIGEAEIGAFELVIGCSPGGVLRFDDVTAGPGPPGFYLATNVKGADSAAVSGFMSGTPITQGLDIATIAFTAVGSPGSSATISVSGAVYDPDGDLIEEVTFSGATVQVTEGPEGNDRSNNMAPILGGIGGGLVIVALIWLGMRNRKKSST